MIDVPFAFSTNGKGILLHDRAAADGSVEHEISLQGMPSPELLWQRYAAWKGITTAQDHVVNQDYFDDGTGKAPRYYQTLAVNRVIEEIAKGRDRLLLVMGIGRASCRERGGQ